MSSKIKTGMIIHCLSCGKAVSSNTCSCPYCQSEISDITLELNGIVEKQKFGERLRESVLQLVHR